MQDSTQKLSDRPWQIVLVVLAMSLSFAAVMLTVQRRAGDKPFDDDFLDEPASEAAPRDLPRIPFTDITAAAGIGFVQRSGAEGEKLLPESGGSGAAFFDYDADGDPDLLLVSGRSWPWSDAAQAQADDTLALYRNDAGTFVDVTEDAGLRAAFVGQGVAIGDYDADGDDDIFVSALAENHLFRNDDGQFTDVAAQAGVAGSADAWTTSAGFFDYDGDGDLDLFVCNYVRWTREVDQAATRRVSNEFHSYAHPENFEGTHNYLYRNDGGQFTDVSSDAGIHVTDPATGSPVGKALAVTFVDVDRDGWLDVLVANDTVRHFLFHNRGDGTFEEIGQPQGFAFNADGVATSGMGVDAAWLRNDDELAIVIGNFADEMTELFVSRPDDSAFFSDDAISAGVGGPTRPMLSFGVLFDDFDLDGRVDLVQANGHLEAEINQADANQQYAQPAQLFWNTGAADAQLLFELPSDNVGDLAKPIVGRGVASADIDGDGDLDLLLTQVDGPPLLLRNDQTTLLRNDQETDSHWLRCRLVGPTGNPHAIGAVVELQAGGTSQRRVVMPTRGYLSQSEPAVTFGLGKRDTVDGLSITWPDGSQQQVAVERVDQLLTVQQELVAESSTAGESFEALANRSKAELENGNYETAIGLLRAASTMQPDFVPIRRNLARALVLGGQAAEAIEVLQQLDADATQPLAANAYLLGLASLRQLDNQAAVGHFRRAVELDPNEATLRFQLALALTGLGETAEAQTEFEQAARLDPLHGGAQYQLAVIARRAGEMDAFRNYMRDYQRIRDLNGTLDAAALEGCRYTQAEAVQTAAESMPQTVDVPSQFMVETLPATAELPGIAALAVFDLADTGRYQLVGVTTEGKAVVLDLDESGHPQLVAQSQFSLEELGSDAMVLVAHAIDDQTLTQVPSAEGGDQPEIAVVTPTRTWLLHYGSDGELRDLTDDSGLAAAAGTVARWVDLDHDGDVDLCTVSADGVRGWRNNSDGTFVEATAEFGLEGFGPATDLAAVDLDATNMGVDLVLAGPDGNALARNQFAGTFASEPTTAAAWPAAQRVLADDFNNDGTPDLLFLAATNSTLALGGDESHQTLSLDFDEIAAAATIDVDNDGWLDVALFGGALFGTANAERRAVLIRNAGGQLVANPEPLPAVEPPRRHGLLDLDADGDGHTDLLVIADDGTLSLLHNDTPTDNRQVKLVLRSFVGHPSSAGVRVEVRRENLFASRWTERELPVEIGIGPHDQADSIQTLWTNGIAKNEIDVPIADAPVRVTIIEFVRTSSCPFLYVWADGGWQFVTDLLGTAPLNVAVARGVPMPPDPDEVVVLGPAERFRDHDVAARLRITSELREVTYLNHARLLAVDHPADATVFSRDRAALTAIDGPQFAVGRAPIAANSAVGSDGVDRTAALAAEDGVLAEPGRLLPPPVVGFTKPLTIEFDFGEIDTSKPYLLALTGWFRFGNSSANIAASQRGDLEVVWPRLEVADAQGQWQLVDDAVGFPAGNTKTIVCDLADKLPHGARRMRLTTSFEVRWDRVALVEAVPTSNVLVTELEPTTAELAWHGFADLHAEQFESPHVPNPRQMSDLPRWLTVVEGWCTRYGDIRPLVATADDRMAVLNSGDGATLEFAADRLPQRTPDTSRTLLLYSRGWIKEADPNSLADRGVSPLPDADLAPDGPLDESLEGDWQLQFNTRWVPSNRFQLGPDGT